MKIKLTVKIKKFHYNSLQRTLGHHDKVSAFFEKMTTFIEYVDSGQ